MKKKIKKIIFIKGKNIYLKPFEEKDITEDYQQHLNYLSGFGIGIIFPKNKLELKKYYRNHKKSNESVFFTICDLKNDENIGTASLSSINWVYRNAMYGRLIFRKFRSYGHGTECLQLIKKYAFNYLNLRSLWTQVFSNNKASIKSNVKSGGKICGELKKHIYKNGKYYNATIIQHIK
jgi:RimJ/RimL family protein N-acetyltransferase